MVVKLTLDKVKKEERRVERERERDGRWRQWKRVFSLLFFLFLCCVDALFPSSARMSTKKRLDRSLAARKRAIEGGKRRDRNEREKRHLSTLSSSFASSSPSRRRSSSSSSSCVVDLERKKKPEEEGKKKRSAALSSFMANDETLIQCIRAEIFLPRRRTPNIFRFTKKHTSDKPMPPLVFSSSSFSFFRREKKKNPKLSKKHSHASSFIPPPPPNNNPPPGPLLQRPHLPRQQDPRRQGRGDLRDDHRALLHRQGLGGHRRGVLCSGDKFFVDPAKLLPMERFLPGAKPPPGGGRGGGAWWWARRRGRAARGAEAAVGFRGGGGGAFGGGGGGCFGGAGAVSASAAAASLEAAAAAEGVRGPRRELRGGRGRGRG